MGRYRVPALASAAAALMWGEWLNRRWSRMLTHDHRAGTLAIVVPGFRNRPSSVNAINRWRTRIALRTIGPHDHDVLVVFSGAAVGGGRSEARLMADYAQTCLGYDGRVALEDRSRSTWENVANALPLVEHADRIAIASQPAHALKARAYLRRQRPDLAARLVPAADYRFGEWAPVKPLLAGYGLWALRRLERPERPERRSH